MFRLLALVAAGLLLTGCTILPNDPTKLTQLTFVESTHDTVTAAAKSAPATAQPAYNKLMGSFNGYVFQMQREASTVGGDTVPFSQVDFSAAAHPVTDELATDLAAFAAAVPSTPTKDFIGATNKANAADIISIAFKVVGAAQNDRKKQAQDLNTQLENLKLHPWNEVNIGH